MNVASTLSALAGALMGAALLAGCAGGLAAADGAAPIDAIADGNLGVGDGTVAPDAGAQEGSAGQDLSAVQDVSVDDAAPFDPVAPDTMKLAFAAARQQAASLFASSQVAFTSVRGVPVGRGATYLTTPFTWTYVFRACDASQSPCAGARAVTVVHPGWTATASAPAPAGLSLLEADFAAAVPLTLAQLAATVRLDQTTCPVPPSAGSLWFIELQGGTKQGSGKPLWYWTFSCNNGLGRPLYLHTNGDPIT